MLDVKLTGHTWFNGGQFLASTDGNFIAALCWREPAVGETIKEAIDKVMPLFVQAFLLHTDFVDTC